MSVLIPNNFNIIKNLKIYNSYNIYYHLLQISSPDFTYAVISFGLLPSTVQATDKQVPKTYFTVPSNVFDYDLLSASIILATLRT